MTGNCPKIDQTPLQNFHTQIVRLL